MQSVVIDRGEGSYAYTVSGEKYLDMATNIGVLSTGHCHPKVVAALQEQIQDVIMAGQNLFPASRPMLALYERFERIMPAGLDHYVLISSGSEAVENAIKIARSATGRQNVIAFRGGFHGRTYGAMALTTSKAVYRQTFGPLMPGVFCAPFPNWLHEEGAKARMGASHPFAAGQEVSADALPSILADGPPASEVERSVELALEALEELFVTHSAPHDTAAIIVEPIQGEGGILPAPRGFLRALRAVADKHGIKLIFDEVQAGMGRSGSWWAHQTLTTRDNGDDAPATDAVIPDIMTFAKGIASGVPFAGVAVKPELTANISGGMLGGTYGGSALGCAAAAATIDAIEEENMLDNVVQRGEQLKQGLHAIAQKHGDVVDVRGTGLMVGVEFRGKHGVAAAVAAECVNRKMLLITAGHRDTCRFLPPLNVSKEEIDEALEIFGQAVDAVLAKEN